MHKYRPPDSDDSDDDYYEGFSFGGDDIKPPPRPIWKADSHERIFDAVTKGDINPVIGYVSSYPNDINEPLRGASTLLHHACKHGHIDIVRYLLLNGSNPNRQVDSYTPLMEACSCLKDSKTAKEICAMLIDQGAVLNVSNKHGQTPFMFACIRGHLSVCEIIIKNISLEACDNQGWTALFYAIENNRPDVVRLLVGAGANVDVANQKGYLPRQIAQFHGFFDILEILPPEKHQYMVPTNFLTYNSIRDHIPRLFLRSEIPEYFQEIDTVLRGMNMEKFLENFALNRIDFAQFLCMTDEKLAQINIELPFHRKSILFGLIKFHLDHWSIKNIARVKKEERESFYDVLMLSSNHLKNIIMVTASIQFVLQNIESNRLGKINVEDIQNIRKSLNDYKNTITKLKAVAKYLNSFTPKKPPLYINFDDSVVQEKKNRMRRYLKYTIFVGVAFVVLIKLNKI